MPEKKKKSNTRNLKIALGLAAVILVPTIGSTLAGTITVGNANTLEFGQGVTATTACSPTLTVTPTSVYSVGSAAFTLDAIAVSEVNANCNNKYLTLKVLNTAGTAQIIGTGSADFCKIDFEVTGGAHTAGATCGVISAASSAAFILTPTTKPPTTAVEKITIESGSVG
jgi:hypothetical protein